MTNDIPPEIFDRRRRSAIWDRSATRRSGDNFLWQYMADELQDRLAMVSRDFADILFIGPIAGFCRQILSGRQASSVVKAHVSAAACSGTETTIEEDRLPFAPDSFDLIISAGTLDSVNDLPGALVQLRRTLRPDGLLLATLFGGGSLRALKASMMRADGDMVHAHIHPQIDLRSGADLMSRAGFALPVADQDRLDVRYRDWRTLVRDLRDSGIGNALAGARSYLGREYPARLDVAWMQLAEADGKVTESFNFLQLSGWAPSPDQPKPAPRGSGSVSLSAVLKPSRK
ncbi:class I SAM-dependent methyltransferase [Sphingorhabdus arenilitoris]|uniref:Class I SAM-dependent methyltransferase n=1 Tax=Sphingorhabdus arenilitoris TaxID=1490041 RepID=A0ABV8REP2_9SPHN